MLAAQAMAMGVTEDFIDRLVEIFYARARAHPRLRPVFDGAIVTPEGGDG
ncbi:hypothetical protein VPG91_04150 [Nitrospirillum amazonense]|nr:hypothetical protein [Nitrospirillum amazonense]MEC4590168.1 hypothetical protein [Nitrospirillum amazonense]